MAPSEAPWWERPDAVPSTEHRSDDRDLSSEERERLRLDAIRLGPTAGRRVFDAVVSLTLGYSKLWDRVYSERVAERAGLKGSTAAKQARQALRRLDDKGFIVYRPARGQGYRSVVGIGPVILQREPDHLPLTTSKGNQGASPEREPGRLPRKVGDSPPPSLNKSLTKSFFSQSVLGSNDARGHRATDGRTRDAPHPTSRSKADGGPRGAQIDVAKHLAKRIGWDELRVGSKPMRQLCELVRPDDDPRPYIEFLDGKPLGPNQVNQALAAIKEVRRTVIDRHHRSASGYAQCGKCNAILRSDRFCCGQEWPDGAGFSVRSTGPQRPSQPSGEPEPTATAGRAVETPTGDLGPFSANGSTRADAPVDADRSGVADPGDRVAAARQPRALVDAALPEPPPRSDPDAERKLLIDMYVERARRLLDCGQAPDDVVQALRATGLWPSEIEEILRQLDPALADPAPSVPSAGPQRPSQPSGEPEPTATAGTAVETPTGDLGPFSANGSTRADAPADGVDPPTAAPVGPSASPKRPSQPSGDSEPTTEAGTAAAGLLDAVGVGS